NVRTVHNLDGGLEGVRGVERLDGHGGRVHDGALLVVHLTAEGGRRQVRRRRNHGRGVGGGVRRRRGRRVGRRGGGGGRSAGTRGGGTGVGAARQHRERQSA